ncbi:aldo/keto reductase [Sphingomonas sp.]|uniref:aldo/keto reductase n=1 Tax=Sphingomonas sp. TaxID=28214 RepID=UPI002BB890AE|nr:aldo/keto reductase [Sphingomonas sp.]HWK36704.1 aldo/keto reductase [Sphingomonas sp.]
MTTLPTRTVGPFTVSAIGLGCMNLNHAYGTPPSPEDGAKLLRRALDLGITLFDTAALYGMGKNEELVGATLGAHRNAFTLASKCVLDALDGKRVLDGTPESITRTVEGSLRRLGTDHIDLLYLHRLDKQVPVEESVGALVRAKEAGKIGAIGLSEMSAATIRRAHAVHPIAAVQTEYSPMVRNPEIAVLDACAELDIAFVAFSPVGRGLLAGAITDDDYDSQDLRRMLPRFVGDNLRHNLIAIGQFNALAGDIGCTPAQLALAWVLAKAPHIIALPGTRSIAHLEEDVAACRVTLSAETVARVDAIFDNDAIRGPRYPAPLQAQVDTETFPDEELG